jgi:hypothetical protein
MIRCYVDITKPFPLDIHYSLFIMKTAAPEIITPEKLPTPWLADSEWLLEELVKCREDALRLPWSLNNASNINSVIDRLWRLEQNLRYLLHLHCEGQRAFARKAEAQERKTRKAAKIAGEKVIRITA